MLETIFAVNLLLLASDHLYTGFLALFFPQKAVRIYRKLFGAELPETKEYLIILRPWGALGIFAGLAGLLPILDPQKYKLILLCLAILLLTRIIYRLKFQREATES